MVVGSIISRVTVSTVASVGYWQIDNAEVCAREKGGPACVFTVSS
jgi:hypothetical protein